MSEKNLTSEQWPTNPDDNKNVEDEEKPSQLPDKEEAAPVSDTIPPLETTNDQEDLETREKEQKIIEQILARGGFNAMVCESQRGFIHHNHKLGGRYQELPNMADLFLEPTPDGTIINHSINQTAESTAIDSDLRNKKILEVVAMIPAAVANYQKKMVVAEPAQKFLGITTKKEMAREIVTKIDDRWLKHEDLVKDGDEEKAYQLIYRAQDSATGAPQEAQYKAGIRRGSELEVKIILPDSLAHDALAAIKNRPELIREMVEKIIKEKIDVPQKQWQDEEGHKTRPPYEG